jgi:hypothetical protein
MGRKVVIIPAWKERQGHENGGSRWGRRVKKRRLTVDDHKRGERKTTHQGYAPEEEEEDN